MKENIKLLGLSVLINAILFSLSIAFFTPTFEASDDIRMMLLSKGVCVSNIGTELILFSSVFYGKYLSFFSNLFSSINFYTWNYLFLFFVSHGLLLFILLKKHTKRANAIICFLTYYIFFSLSSFLKMQFTVLCALIACISLIALDMALVRKNYKYLTVAILFYLFSLLIRKEMAIIIGILSLPFFAYRVFILRDVKKLSFFIVVAVIAYTGLNTFDASYYKLKSYDFHQTHPFIATVFVDYYLIDKISPEQRQKLKKEYNWNENDIRLYKSWFIKNTEVFDKTKFDFAKIKPLVWGYILSKSLSPSFEFIMELGNFAYFRIASFFLVILFVFNWDKKIKLCVLSIAIGLTTVFLLYFLSALKFVPFRVLFSVAIFFASFIFYSIPNKIIINKKIQYAVCLLTLFLGYRMVLLNLKVSSINQQEISETRELINSLDTNRIYISWGNAIPWDGINPFDNLNSLKKLNVFSLASGSDHPAILQKYPMFKNNFLKEICSNPKVNFLVKTDGIRKKQEILNTYFKDHFNQSISFKDTFIKKIGNNISVSGFSIEKL